MEHFNEQITNNNSYNNDSRTLNRHSFKRKHKIQDSKTGLSEQPSRGLHFSSSCSKGLHFNFTLSGAVFGLTAGRDLVVGFKEKLQVLTATPHTERLTNFKTS